MKSSDMIETMFEFYRRTPGDIEEHLETFYEYGTRCKTIVELGTRKLVSTWAWLKARPEKLLCVDLLHPSEYGAEGNVNIQIAIGWSELFGIDFEFIKGNDLEVEIPEADLIFIDTDHTYEQLDKELKKFGDKAKKYLVFHDTNIESMTKAIWEFLDKHMYTWKLVLHHKNNNGIIILERIQ